LYDRKTQQRISILGTLPYENEEENNLKCQPVTAIEFGSRIATRSAPQISLEEQVQVQHKKKRRA
jgi:hypothetical protein